MSPERCKKALSCRSRIMLQNEYFIAKIGVDTAENEPSEVWPDYGLPRAPRVVPGADSRSGVFRLTKPESVLSFPDIRMFQLARAGFRSQGGALRSIQTRALRRTSKTTNEIICRK